MFSIKIDSRKNRERRWAQDLLPITVQPRLAIGPVDDPYEREAERVADQVMRMPAPAIQRAPLQIQRCGKCAKATRIEDMCPSCAAKARADGLLQRDAAGAVPEVTTEVESNIGAMRGGGQPLDAGLRAFMEPRFGHDFGNVRVHTNARAASTATAVNALAFTTGRDVVFGTGQYQPGTDAGKRLIAHELTHVVQQDAGLSSHVRSFVPTIQSKRRSDSKLPLANKWKVRIRGSAGGGYVLGLSVFGLEIIDLDNNLRMYYFYRGGLATLGPGLSAGLIGASPGTDWQEFTTSVPIRISDFEGPARHTTGGIQLGYGPSAEYIHLFGPSIAGANSVYLGWMGIWEEGWGLGGGTDVGPLEPVTRPEKVPPGYM